MAGRERALGLGLLNIELVFAVLSLKLLQVFLHNILFNGGSLCCAAHLGEVATHLLTLCTQRLGLQRCCVSLG